MIDRRALLVGAAAGMSALAGRAEACSLTIRNLPFDDNICRQRIRDFNNNQPQGVKWFQEWSLERGA